MAKLHFVIGKASTEPVSPNHTATVLLQDTVRPIAVPTYCRQITEGCKVLVDLGNTGKIIDEYLLPFFRSADEETLAAKKEELDSLEAGMAARAATNCTRAEPFLSFLSSKDRLDRKLFPIAEKVKRGVTLSNKDLTPLIDAVYTVLRKTASATSGHKEKMRAYVQTGNGDSQFLTWLGRWVDPVFSSYQRIDDLKHDLEAASRQRRSTDDPKLKGELRTAIEDIKSGRLAGEVRGLGVQGWLEEGMGCQIQRNFFGEVSEVVQGLPRRGSLILEPSRSVKHLDNAIHFLPLDKFSSIVCALDRALSHLVVAYANAEPEMKTLYNDRPIHSGLLIRALLEEDEAIRTLYPLQMVTDKPELNAELIARVRAAYESGSMARVCAAEYSLDEEELLVGLETAVTVQRILLPLLPVEVHRLAQAMETVVQLRRTAKKPGAVHQKSTLHVNFRAQLARYKEIGKSLKRDFHVDPTKMFHIDNALIDNVKSLFGSELEFLRLVLERYIHAEKETNVVE